MILFSIIFAAIFGCIFLAVCVILASYGARTYNWYPFKVVIFAGGILCLLVAIGIGSQVVFFFRLTRDAPDKAALVGTWRQDKYTSYPAKITLKADGSFILNDSQEPTTGKWELSKDGDFWNIDLLSDSWVQFGLIGRSPPYQLYSYVGDADNNEKVVYTKSE